MSHAPLTSERIHGRPGAAFWQFDVSQAWALLDTSVTRGGPGWAKEGLERFLARVVTVAVSDAA
ncbi:MAG TPA: hypothetical protein VIN06_13410, partial [Devosia sp.]